jgi:hypothetical protein
MHPDLLRPENIKMDVYVLGNKHKIDKSINRLYEIASEIKRHVNKE